jgi:tRNA pseudouridine synthase 10
LVRQYEKNKLLFKKFNCNQLIHYNLYICNYCFERNFKFVKNYLVKYKTLIKIIRSKQKECSICKNLFQRTIDPINNEIINSCYFLNSNQIHKIDIGISLPLLLFEKEDNLRSLFKIKGIVNIKNHYNTLIRQEIIKKSGYVIDHLNPDIRIEIQIDKECNFEIKYKTKELVLLGKYNKYERGWSQRFRMNIMDNDNKSRQTMINLDSYNIIEEIILNFLYTQTGSKDIHISWSGSEDKDSLVLGNGRPFIVKIISPQSRNIQRIFDIKDKLKLSFEEINIKDTDRYFRYKVHIKILIRIVEDNLKNINIEESISKLKGETRFRLKNKTIKKNIYSTNFKIIDNNNLEINLLLDNGIPIKQLIGGKEFIEPCLSNLINKKCECVFFDIKEVILSDN